MTRPSLRILVPVFNDYESFRTLFMRLDEVAADLPYLITVTIIDDGSLPLVPAEVRKPQHICRLEAINLAVNVGHQRAIAIGLCVAAEDNDSNFVLIMDADGEDPPEALPILLQQTLKHDEICLVASRTKRSENIQFKASYLAYKTVFRLLTGRQIDFGNFSLLSASYVKRLILIPDLWNNLPAALLRSRIPINKIGIARGKRYAGKSQMNSTALLVHGISALSVYADAVFVRLLKTTMVLVILTGFAMLGTLTLRIFAPAHASPGWATTVIFGMIIILLQVFFTAMSAILMLLNNRVQRLILPVLDYKPYIASRTIICEQGPSSQLCTDSVEK